MKELKVLNVCRARTMRELVNEANVLKVTKDEFALVLQDNGYYVLLYYK